MPRIFHITTRSAWAEASRAGSYQQSTRGLSLAEVGFIHASYAHQVTHTANILYPGITGLVVLVIDPDRLTAELRDEAVPGQAHVFPHIYGPLNLDAVVDVLALEPAADGSFAMPAALRSESAAPD